MNWWDGFFAGIAVSLVPSAMVFVIIIGGALMRAHRRDRTEVDLTIGLEAVLNEHYRNRGEAGAGTGNVRHIFPRVTTLHFHDPVPGQCDTPPGGGHAA